MMPSRLVADPLAQLYCPSFYCSQGTSSYRSGMCHLGPPVEGSAYSVIRIIWQWCPRLIGSMLLIPRQPTCSGAWPPSKPYMTVGYEQSIFLVSRTLGHLSRGRTAAFQARFTQVSPYPSQVHQELVCLSTLQLPYRLDLPALERSVQRCFGGRPLQVIQESLLCRLEEVPLLCGFLLL